MDFHLERGRRLHTEPEHESLYSWAINEIDAQGQQIGNDQIPWVQTLNFTATSCALRDGIEMESTTKKNTAVSFEIAQRQVFQVQLRQGAPWDDGNYFHETTFSMFGTDRAIKSFDLRRDTVEALGDQKQMGHPLRPSSGSA